MLSSASTWLYNATLKAATALHPTERVVGDFIENRDDIAKAVTDADILVVKTHAIQESALAWLAHNATTIMISIRDPRDAVASLMEYNGSPFGAALDFVVASLATCAAFRHDPRATLFRYEDRFTDQPETIQHIAMLLGGALPAGTHGRIVSELRREAIEDFISRLPLLPTAICDPKSGDLYDQRTHWHRHHAGRTGAIGRWQQRLVPGQVMIAESTLQTWMEQFGYATTSGRIKNFARA
jgi:hypothetical protein